MELALYEPDIPQNTGAMIRLGACLGVPIHIIEPCGFPFSAKAMKRTGMDYIDQAKLTRHTSWEAFEEWRNSEAQRLVLLTTKTNDFYTDFKFQKTDIILVGRESAGVPKAVVEAADQTLTIPLAPGLRSLNVTTAAAIVLGEGLRQTGAFSG